MALSRRYHPEIAPGETSIFGMDFSPIIPVGVGIASATLAIKSNATPALPIDVTPVGEVSWIDRTVYSTVTAGFDAGGEDLQFLWTATDTDGNIWPRTALCLCAPTS